MYTEIIDTPISNKLVYNEESTLFLIEICIHHTSCES